MQTSPSILLISHHPNQLYDRVLEANGFTVDFVRSIEAAPRFWQPGKYRLLLVEPYGNLKDALHFCSETKKQIPNNALHS